MRLPCLILISLSLASCESPASLTPLQVTCKEIALNRIKHPDSYESVTADETRDPSGPKTTTTLGFTAWNGYKVPIPYKIECIFQDATSKTPLRLTHIRWNGRLIRQTELDEINENLALKQTSENAGSADQTTPRPRKLIRAES